MSFTKKLAAGVQNAWFWFNDSDGFAIGSDTTALTAGTSRGAQRFVGIQQMPTGITEGEVVPIDGDDTNLGGILFESNAPVEFLINFGQGDQSICSRLPMLRHGASPCALAASGSVTVMLVSSASMPPTFRMVCSVFTHAFDQRWL